VEFYDKGGIPNKNSDEKIVKLNLTGGEKADLVAFLTALPFLWRSPPRFRSRSRLQVGMSPRLRRG
jgi:hypothetical protein